MLYGEIDDVNLEAIENMEALAGQSMFGMYKGTQRTTPGVASNHMRKKRNLPFDVGNLDLKTVNVDLLHCLCGSYK